MESSIENDDGDLSISSISDIPASTHNKYHKKQIPIPSRRSLRKPRRPCSLDDYEVDVDDADELRRGQFEHKCSDLLAAARSAELDPQRPHNPTKKRLSLTDLRNHHNHHHHHTSHTHATKKRRISLPHLGTLSLSSPPPLLYASPDSLQGAPDSFPASAWDAIFDETSDTGDEDEWCRSPTRRRRDTVPTPPDPFPAVDPTAMRPPPLLDTADAFKECLELGDLVREWEGAAGYLDGETGADVGALDGGEGDEMVMPASIPVEKFTDFEKRVEAPPEGWRGLVWDFGCFKGDVDPMWGEGLEYL